MLNFCAKHKIVLDIDMKSTLVDFYLTHPKFC